MILRVGTRGSALALAQTSLVVKALEALPSVERVETVTIQTTGDLRQGNSDGRILDKREWIHELEMAVLNQEIDIALHSGKDIPAQISAHTDLHSVLERATPFDVFIGKRLSDVQARFSIHDLTSGGIVGTASLRRRAQLLKNYPRVSVVEHRGNVPTRLSKLEQSSSLSGIILAQAGIERLGIADIEGELLRPPEFIPAINQGILVAQFRENRQDITEAVRAVSDASTESAFQAERACVSHLPADCDSAVGIFCESDPNGTGHALLHARVLTPDGKECIEIRQSMPLSDSHSLGMNVGKELIQRGAKELLDRSREFFETSN